MTSLDEERPLIRCVCGEIEANRVHHETQLSGWHPFAGEATMTPTDPASAAPDLATARPCTHRDAQREYVPINAFRSTCQVCGAVALHPAVGGSEPDERPFVVRQFEGKPWVPLHEAGHLHDAHQRTVLANAGLRNEIAALRAALEGSKP